MKKNNTFYVTTPIYYVTARPHLGSLYSTVIADAIARWQKLQNKEVFFLTGTDEFGQKIALAAQKVGKEPKAFVDSFINAYQDTWHQFEIQYDYFMRTTDEYHIKAVQDWIRALIKKGDIYKDHYSGWYCTPCETFVTESGDVQEPPCSSCGRQTQLVSEESYFFRLSNYQQQLLDFYQSNPDFIIPRERSHEVIEFVKRGLKDLSISRTTVSWGVPFPDDSKHVTYVWADALNNYITAIGYGQPGRQDQFNAYWPAALQVMGKDIIRFHAVYWPAFLMASGLDLPKHLLVHGWIKINQQKMSKSFGNVIDPMDLLHAYGADAVRYYLLRYMAISHDGEFSIKQLEQAISSDLANDLGNLLNRILGLSQRYQMIEVRGPQVWNTTSLQLRDACITMIEEYKRYMDEYQIHMALAAVWKCINAANAYVHERQPWKCAKENRIQLEEIMSAVCHSLHTIALVLWPIMPGKMIELLQALGVSADRLTVQLEEVSIGNWNRIFMINQTKTLFNKPEAEEDKANVQGKTTTEVQVNESIEFSDFSKVQLVVGTIIECIEVAGSDKLYQLQVSFGSRGKRQILSGIRKHFLPTDLIGKQAIFVFNLKPRKMMGLESQGMMLLAHDADKKLQISTVGAPVPDGTQLQ